MPESVLDRALRRGPWFPLLPGFGMLAGAGVESNPGSVPRFRIGMANAKPRLLEVPGLLD